MKRTLERLIFLLFMVLLPVTPTNAQVIPENADKRRRERRMSIQQFVLGEFALLAHSAMPIADPDVVGWTMVGISGLAIPATLDWKMAPASSLSVLIGYGGLGAYNIGEFDKDQDSEATIFVRNLIGFHAILATQIAVSLTFDEPAFNSDITEREMGLNIGVVSNTPVLLFTYRFFG